MNSTLMIVAFLCDCPCDCTVYTVYTCSPNTVDPAIHLTSTAAPSHKVYLKLM